MKTISAIGSAIGGIFSPATAKATKPQAVVASGPRDRDAAADAARKRLRARSEKGREGTIYSPTYGGTNLGGTA